MHAGMTDSASPLRLALLTEGDPRQLSGGYLYQQRMAAAGPSHGAQVDFLSIPSAPFALQIAQARHRLATLPSCDVLLLDSIVAAAAAWWLRAVVRRMPVIALAHQQPGGADNGPVRSPLQRRLDLVAYRRATGVIAVSDWLASCLLTQGVPADRVVVVPPGADIPEASSAIDIDLRMGRRAAVLCVSNWQPNKGIHLLLDAVAGLDAETATVHLVGNPAVDSRYQQRIRSRLARADLRDRVVVHGPLPPAEVARLLHSADLLAHPSRHEAYGAVAAEAMSAGLPVIAFRVDNLPYLVRDGIDGMLAPFPDVRWLSAALRVLIENPTRRQEMGAAARARALTWPTWAQSADRFFGAVRQALAAP